MGGMQKPLVAHLLGAFYMPGIPHDGSGKPQQHRSRLRRSEMSASLNTFARSAVSRLRRWNLARETSDDLHSLTVAQRRDLGLDGVDLDDLAGRLAR
ncbi:MAG: hypothetical protein AAF192_06510 [Pseudomonadota bacterium]